MTTSFTGRSLVAGVTAAGLLVWTLVFAADLVALAREPEPEVVTAKALLAGERPSRALVLLEGVVVRRDRAVTVRGPRRKNHRSVVYEVPVQDPTRTTQVALIHTSGHPVKLDVPLEGTWTMDDAGMLHLDVDRDLVGQLVLSLICLVSSLLPAMGVTWVLRDRR